METWRHRQGDMCEEIWRHQTETEAQAIFLNPFTACSMYNGSLKFVRLLTKKQTEVIRLQSDKTD
jgi:hypothetical protein